MQCGIIHSLSPNIHLSASRSTSSWHCQTLPQKTIGNSFFSYLHVNIFKRWAEVYFQMLLHLAFVRYYLLIDTERKMNNCYRFVNLVNSVIFALFTSFFTFLHFLNNLLLCEDSDFKGFFRVTGLIFCGYHSLYFHYLLTAYVYLWEEHTRKGSYDNVELQKCI